MKVKIKLLLSTVIFSMFFVGCSSSGDEQATNESAVTESSEETIPEESEIVDTGKNIEEKDDMFVIPESVDDLPQFQPLETGDQMATIKTSMGDITVRLFPEYAPLAVENFVTHAQNGYYDGLIFHRVITDFMIQGGDPNGNGTGGESIWGDAFEDEFSNLLRNFNGALSMANSGTNTNGSQFFIVQNNAVDESTLASLEQTREVQDEIIGTTDDGYTYKVKNSMPTPVIDKYEEIGGTPHLDFAHTVFGQVVDGMSVVDAAAVVETDENDKPLEDIVINSIEIYEYE